MRQAMLVVLVQQEDMCDTCLPRSQVAMHGLSVLAELLVQGARALDLDRTAATALLT